MKSGRWQWLRRMPEVLSEAQLEPAEQTRRHVARQRNIFLPARLIVVTAVLYQLYTSPWLAYVVNTYGVVFETIQGVIRAYATLAVVATVVFFVVRRFPPGIIQWLVFFFGLADGVFLGGLTVLTGGFESILYWVYPALIILNAASIPLAAPQIVLNLMLGIIFLTAGLIETSAQPDLAVGGYRRAVKKITEEEIKNPYEVAAWLQKTPPPFRRILWDGLSETTRSNIINQSSNQLAAAQLQALLAQDLTAILPSPRNYMGPVPEASEAPEPGGSHYVLQVAVLLLLTFCCYGVQVLAAGQRRADDERNEFLVRGEQLRSTGRLAAEVAHQIKNPLAIINNVTFSLQKNFAQEKPATRQQIEIIREEVAKADRIITQIMGYAQLTEGRVEKLNVIDELNRAIEEVFPSGVLHQVQIRRDFVGHFPPLLLQRKHFNDAVSNLLQNARDASPAAGKILVTARFLPDESIAITVSDEGPGIPADKVERIFEAYYTTKPQGSGLGLAVVKHNTELYGGTVRVESELGKGAKFTLIFPSKTLMKPIT
jgi:signal transduction histidine kinase